VKERELFEKSMQIMYKCSEKEFFEPMYFVFCICEEDKIFALKGIELVHQ
jgi:hypothetical protein